MSARIFSLVVFTGLFLIVGMARAEEASFAIIGDAGKWTPETKAIKESIESSGVKRLILPGDNLYKGTYGEQWSPWGGFEFSVVAIGNHNDGYSNEIAYFQMPGEFYEKSVAGVRFLVLNSDNKLSYEEQAKWLDEQLAKVSLEPTFLVWHHPTYTVSSFHPWTERQAFQKRMRLIMKKNRDKFVALLVGHDHIGATYCVDNIPMIVSGAIFETRKPEVQTYVDAKDGSHVTAKWVFPANTHVWARLDVDSEIEKIQLSFVRSPDSAVLNKVDLNPTSASFVCRP